MAGTRVRSEGDHLSALIPIISRLGGPKVIGTGELINQNFTQMFGYNPAGQMVRKRLRLTQVTGGNSTPVNTDWDTRYEYDDEGYLLTTGYPNSSFYNVALDPFKRPAGLYVGDAPGVYDGAQHFPIVG